MKMGMHKPGQGYWVRMLTAVFAGFLILRGVVWVWLEIQSVNPPVTSWIARLGESSGQAPTPGGRVTLLRDDPDSASRVREVGTAEVRAFSEASKELVLVKPELGAGEAISLARLVQVPGEAGVPAFQAPVTQVSDGDRLFEILYLQGAVAGVVILIGAGVVFYFVGVNARSVDFLIATDGEMKKVNWSTRKDVIASTWVVIGASLLIATGLYLVDIVFSSFFAFIDVLKR